MPLASLPALAAISPGPSIERYTIRPRRGRIGRRSSARRAAERAGCGRGLATGPAGIFDQAHARIRHWLAPELRQRHLYEGPLTHTGMRQRQLGGGPLLARVEQQVNVDLAWAEPGPLAPSLLPLDLLGREQQILRAEVRLGLDYCVEEGRLLAHVHRLGLVQRRYPPEPHAAPLQRLQRTSELIAPVAHVGAQPEIHLGDWAYPRTIASATCTTRAMGRTSWTRTAAAPPAMAMAAAAAVPSTRSCSAVPRSRPRKRLRDGPTSTG